MQDETSLLVDQLLESGKKVLIETNGSQPINKINFEAIRIIDVKLPGSGEENSFHIQNLNYITDNDELKFVISNRYDFNEAIEFIHKHDLKNHTLLFSPVSGQVSPQNLSQWILDEKITVRLHLQLHKIIWPNEERGH